MENRTGPHLTVGARCGPPRSHRWRSEDGAAALSQRRPVRGSARHPGPCESAGRWLPRSGCGPAGQPTHLPHRV